VPHGNFFPLLHVENSVGGEVEAAGPLDQDVTKVTEMCVWVIQRNGRKDIIANAMGEPVMGNPPPNPPAAPAMAGMYANDLTIWNIHTATAWWTYTLPQEFTQFKFSEGGAVALAIAVFEDQNGKQRAFTWSETVQLTYAPVAVPPPP
jgi:hypothetical protein